MVAGRLQEKNGFFYIVLSYTDSAGKRRQPWIGTGLPVKGNKKRAEKMLAETRKSFTIPKGQVSELSPDMAFSDYMRYWLKMMRTAVTETTYSSYCFNVEKHIIPYFEPLGVTLAGLQPRQIQSFYAFAESVPFTALPTGEVQQFEMLDDVIKVEISKKDLTTMEELPGAELTLTDKGGTVVEHWTSTDKPHYIEKLPAGDYTLTEVKAPDGYAFAESVPFTVLPTGEVQRFEMLDDVIKVEISKVDITTNKELPGAELIITNKDGKVVEHWTSTDKPHYIEKLPAGEYTLTEITAPNGYEIAEDIPFTVLPTGEVQRVVMKDAPIPEQPVQPTPPTTPTPTPLIPQTGDTFPLGLLLALAGLSLAGLAALIFKCVHCKAVAQKDDDETE